MPWSPGWAVLIDYLKVHGRIADLAFYVRSSTTPTNVIPNGRIFYREPELISHIMKVWRNDGVPEGVPLMMTEGNMAASSGGRFPEIMGALWLADFEGSFFTAGGTAAYYYHYIPEPMWRGCDAGGGSFSSIQVDSDYKLKRLSLAILLPLSSSTREWVQPVDEPHRLFRVKSSVRNPGRFKPGHGVRCAASLMDSGHCWWLIKTTTRRIR